MFLIISQIDEIILKKYPLIKLIINILSVILRDYSGHSN
jgi:hypothetical protein